MVTEKENFKVDAPYQPTEDEKKTIKELEDKGLVGEDWDSGKKHIKSFKENLREDMYEKQNKLCAYCRVHVPLACVHLHRDHIVHKDEHPQWLFLPENLCVACDCCNEFKGTDEVLVNPKTTTYPDSGDGFKIIHPLYDKYSEHIDLIGGILYQGKTDKGIFTIKTCHLYRVELAEERADQKMHDQNKGNIVADLVYLTTLSSEYVDKNDKFLEYVKGIVMEYQQMQGRREE